MAVWASVCVKGDTLIMTGVLNHETVLEVDKQGRQWISAAEARECKIDLGAITYSSSAGIALLLGWLRMAEQQKKTLQFLQAPASMVALAKVGGLEDLLV